MKKQYMKPAVQVVKIQQSQMLCGSDPKAKDEVGGGTQFSRRYNGYNGFDNEDNEEEDDF